jgi:hypothetical protein
MPKGRPNIVWCSYLKNRKNNFKRKGKRNFAFFRWTNIPEQNFNPQLEQVIHNDYSSISNLPLSRETFFIKYPWILEDIVV